MKKNISNFLAKCTICQQIKDIPKAQTELLLPVEPPNQVGEALLMDFVIHLPALHNNTIIMVIAHWFWKATRFSMLPTHFTTSKATEFYTRIISKLHGYMQYNLQRGHHFFKLFLADFV